MISISDAARGSGTIVDLDWYRDAAGYELLPEEPSPPGASLLSGFANSLRIVPRGGQRINYKPLQGDRLYARFAGIHTAGDALAFINRFGALTELGTDPGSGEDVHFILEHASAFRSFLSYGAEQERELGSWAGLEGKRIGRLDLVLKRDPVSGSLRLTLAPPTLLAGLWLQLAQKITGARPFRECRCCKTWFEVGPGTNRRLDAVFCTDDHRVLFNSRKRSKGTNRYA
jgi:hypothetical protein